MPIKLISHKINGHLYITEPEAKILPGDYFIAHFSNDEKEIRQCRVRDVHGHYIDWNNYYTCGGKEGNNEIRLVYQRIVNTNDRNLKDLMLNEERE